MAGAARWWLALAQNRYCPVIYEIVILAMIAAFLGLRLYSVLGRRAEHEEEVVPTRFDQGKDAAGATHGPRQEQNPPIQLRPRDMAGAAPMAEQGIRAIAGADRQFELGGFLQGAQMAFEMFLEAFWRGDRDELKELCTPEVYEGFAAAIAAREAAGETLENRLVRIEEAAIQSARLEGRTARIAVRFAADIAAVTRDRDGNVIAGSLDDAVESRDVWTFVRQVGSATPEWLLEETDEG